eukprot:TRINITY_DN23556_c0_g1_i1.p1 TRINITY_DN23556_c0_g1~~TRINITY_DN23556_c0_g1_i1.p1  ORF type:complete len:210 (+),score=48.12 TRINITY_DN23556_c0_g1_i1:51-632(+)
MAHFDDLTNRFLINEDDELEHNERGNWFVYRLNGNVAAPDFEKYCDGYKCSTLEEAQHVIGETDGVFDNSPYPCGGVTCFNKFIHAAGVKGVEVIFCFKLNKDDKYKVDKNKNMQKVEKEDYNKYFRPGGGAKLEDKVIYWTLASPLAKPGAMEFITKENNKNFQVQYIALKSNASSDQDLDDLLSQIWPNFY